MTRMMMAAAVLLASLSAGPLAQAQTDPELQSTQSPSAQTQAQDAGAGSVMAVVPGSGEITISGARLIVDRVIYFHFNNNGRTSFSVFTDIGAIGFSGDQDARPQAHLYTLTADSVVRTKQGKEGVRTPATGECRLAYGDTQNDVDAIDCKADTDTGPVLLHFKGNGEPAKVTPLRDSGPPPPEETNQPPPN
ncbi:MAG: hypothetical protein JWP35_2794 [Caulobacter sp.]|nr:hypothetical protein [Caulobacter sp.]